MLQQFTQVLAISRIESRVTPGRIKPSRGAVAISTSTYATSTIIINAHERTMNDNKSGTYYLQIYAGAFLR